MDNKSYWRAQVRLLAVTLSIWFIASFGCGILFVDELNALSIGGVPLGFWFAQQGSIYLFLFLIVGYGWFNRRLEKRLLGEPLKTAQRKRNEHSIDSGGAN